MPEYKQMTDAAVLTKLGEGLARRRLEINLTQAQVAQEAGVSRRTLGRIENGESTQLTNLIRIVRALGLLDKLDALFPPPAPSPLEQLRTQGKRRRRASRATASAPTDEEWAWADSEERQDDNS